MQSLKEIIMRLLVEYDSLWRKIRVSRTFCKHSLRNYHERKSFVGEREPPRQRFYNRGPSVHFVRGMSCLRRTSRPYARFLNVVVKIGNFLENLSTYTHQPLGFNILILMRDLWSWMGRGLKAKYSHSGPSDSWPTDNLQKRSKSKWSNVWRFIVPHPKRVIAQA